MHGKQLFMEIVKQAFFYMKLSEISFQVEEVGATSVLEAPARSFDNFQHPQKVQAFL